MVDPEGALVAGRKTLAVVLQDSGWDHVYLIPADGWRAQGTYAWGVGGHERGVFTGWKSLAVVSNRGGMLEESDIWIVPADGGTPLRQLAQYGGAGCSRSRCFRRMDRRFISTTTSAFRVD